MTHFYRSLLTGALLLVQQWSIAASPDQPAQTGPVDTEAVCALPPYLLATDTALPNSRDALSDKASLNVMMVGAGAMAGRGTGSAEQSYPDQFVRRMAQVKPGLNLKLTRFAARGQTLAGSVRQIQDNIDSLQPDLVIWQIGLSDVAGRMPLSRFNRFLEQGIAAVQATGNADLILADFPYYPEAHLLIDTADYLSLIRFRANYEEIPLFSIYDLMNYWSERETFPPDPSTNNQRERALNRANRIHHCLGIALAAQILRGSD